MISGNIGGFNLNFVLNSKNWWYKMIGKILNKVINPIITSIIKFVNLALGVNLSRYFVTLDPVLNSYYELAAPITFAGDFEVEFTVYNNTTNNEQYLCFSELGGTLNYIRLDYLNNSIDTTIGGAFTSGDGLSVFVVGKFNVIKVTRSNSIIKTFLNGVLTRTTLNQNTGEILFNTLGVRHTNYFNGIIANAKFTDKSGASDVVTTFKLDNSPAAENYTYSTELLDNNTFPDNANARQYLVATKGWIITDGGAV